MDKTRPPEERNMAKIQKSFYLNPDFCELIADYEKRTGASFTRVMTASSLSFLFGGYLYMEPPPQEHWLDDDTPPGDTPKPHAGWMELAVALERGEISISDVIPEILKARIEGLRQSTRFFHGEEKSESTRRLIAEWNRTISYLEIMLRRWEADANEMGKLGAAKYRLDGKIRRRDTGEIVDDAEEMFPEGYGPPDASKSDD